MFQKGVWRREEGVAEVKLVWCRKEQGSHVDREKVGAVAASHSHSLEEAATRNTDREDGVAEVAMNITKLVGRRKVVH